MGSEMCIRDSSNVVDWILTPNGDFIFYLMGDGSLHQYSIAPETHIRVVDSFQDTFQKKTRLFHSLDNRIMSFNNDDNTVSFQSYSYIPGEYIAETIRRLSTPLPVQFQLNSMAPDGSSVIFTHQDAEGTVFTQLSLNSKTERTVRIETPVAAIDSFVWSANARSFAYVARDVSNVHKVVVVTLGTLSATDVLVGFNADGVDDLQWSPRNEALSFRQNGVYKLVTLSDQVVSVITEDLTQSQDSYSGWFTVPGVIDSE